MDQENGYNFFKNAGGQEEQKGTDMLELSEIQLNQSPGIDVSVTGGGDHENTL